MAKAGDGILLSSLDVTEQKRTQEALSESEANYRLLFDTIDEGFCIVEVLFDDANRAVDYRFVEANASFERQTGLKDAAGKLMRALEPALEQHWFDIYGEIALTGEPKRFEARAEALGRWYSVYAFRVDEPERRRVAILFDDISERKRTESALRESEERQAFLLALGDAMRAQPAAEDKIEVAARLLGEKLAASRVLYAEYDHEKGLAHIFNGWLADGAQPFPSVVKLENFEGEVLNDLREGRVVRVDDVGRLGAGSGYAAIASVQVQALLSPALLVDGKLAFNVSIHQDKPRHWTDDEVALVQEVSERLWAEVVRARAEQALRESEERLRQFGEASQDILWIRDAQALRWTYLTPAFETIYGLSREEALTRDNFRSWLELIVPEDRPRAIENIRRVRKGQHVAFEYRIRRPADGKIRWLRDTDFPIVADGGAVDFIGGIGSDITAAKLTTERLEQSEERLRSAVEVGRLGLWDWNVLTGEIHWSDEHFRMEGYAVGEVTPSYEAWASRIHPDDRAGAEAALRQARDGGHEFDHEFRTLHPDGAVRWLHGRGRFFYDEAGRAVRMVGAMTDTTVRREWEERQTVLVAELQHRTRNLITVVSSMADRTMRRAADLPEFRDSFGDRLAALARVQGLLSRLQEHDRVTFDELTRTEMASLGVFDGAADRVVLQGPAGIRLRSGTVQTLAMALHELATNAAKYGALRQATGRLEVTWRLEPPGDGAQPLIHIDWRERGVVMPEPGAAPDGTGQGRELIEHALPYQLKAKTRYEFLPDGVHCTISVPISASTPGF
ncbi:PAS domain-containing protein [Mangrovicella endophytica]|uniref:PAS domain-containing protein n=1 Tax=Mangrovicella endophytica TaxID=2066697 RepID=UPI0024782AF8|nr:PAS domain-containing protein [Mangrovicella endophytica]